MEWRLFRAAILFLISSLVKSSRIRLGLVFVSFDSIIIMIAKEQSTKIRNSSRDKEYKHYHLITFKEQLLHSKVIPAYRSQFHVRHFSPAHRATKKITPPVKFDFLLEFEKDVKQIYKGIYMSQGQCNYLYKVLQEWLKQTMIGITKLSPLRLIQNLQTVKLQQMEKNKFSGLQFILIRKLLSFVQQYAIIIHAHLCLTPSNLISSQLQQYLTTLTKHLNRQHLRYLVHIYISEAQAVLFSKRQICRICQTSIQVELMERHVQICERLAKENQNLLEDNDEFIKITTLVSQKILQIKQKHRRNSGKEIFITPFDNCLTPSLKEQKSMHDQKEKSSIDQLPLLQTLRFLLQKFRKKYADILIETCEMQPIFDQIKELYKLQIEIQPLLRLEQLLKRRKKIESRIRRYINEDKKIFINTKMPKENKVSQSLHYVKQMISSCIYKQAAKAKSVKKVQFIDEEQTKQQQIFNSQEKKKKKKKNKKKKMTKSRTVLYEEMIISFDLPQRNVYSEGQTLPLEKNELVQISHFKLIRRLGGGSFGNVYLVKRKTTGDYYALKLLKKSIKNKIQNLRTQHKVFELIQSQFVVRASYSFPVGQWHAFILEYMKGGNLGELLENEVYIEENIAKYYIAEIIQAIQYLHSLNIIHRDLKPENIVIDDKGHLKLTDFGLSSMGIKMKTEDSNQINTSAKKIKRLSSRKEDKKEQIRLSVIKRVFATSIDRKLQYEKPRVIGTPDYIAPEVINGKSSDNKTIDWWSLGVMTYQILTGVPPFTSQTESGVFENILQRKIEWPDIGQEGPISKDAYDFICRLLVNDQNLRLGAEGAAQIKSHPFMAEIDWDNLRLTPPKIKPDIEQTIEQIYYDDIEEEIVRMFEGGKIGSIKCNQSIPKTMVRVDILKQQTLQKSQQQQIGIQKMRKKFEALLTFAQRL